MSKVDIDMERFNKKLSPISIERLIEQIKPFRDEYRKEFLDAVAEWIKDKTTHHFDNTLLNYSQKNNH